MKQLIISIFAFIQRYIYTASLRESLKIHWLELRSYWLLPRFKKIHRSVRFGRIGSLRGTENITIGAHTGFGDDIYLTTWPKHNDEFFTPELVIGDNCSFGAFNHITCIGRMIIGNNVLTGKWVTISDNNHGDTSLGTLHIAPSLRPLTYKGGVTIGDNVWIGDKATILSGVTVGEGAVIAANAVVTKNVPAFSVIAGNPAKVVVTNGLNAR